jgi:hypothetical protein
MSDIESDVAVEGDEIDVEAVLEEPAEQKENQHDQPPDYEPPPDEAEEPPPPPEGGGGPAAGHSSQPIAATCSHRFTAVHHDGNRPVSSIDLVVIHSTEGPTAAGGASWFADNDSKGSAHLVVDDAICYRTLEDAVIPWGAPGANTRGFHIEHAGLSAWNRQKWLSHEQTLRRGAFKAAFHAVKFGIPIKLLSANDLRHGRSGFVTHNTVSEVFHGDHTDPGPGFPLDHFMQLVKSFADDMQD